MSRTAAIVLVLLPLCFTGRALLTGKVYAPVDLASLVTAAGWMFSGNVAFFVGWPLARSWAYLPLLFFAVRLVVREASIRSGMLLLTILTFLVLSGHPESLLHVTAVGAAYGLF